MLVLREGDIVPVLKGLTQQECQDFLANLEQALVCYSAREGDKLIHQPLREMFTTIKGHTSLFMPASDTVNTTGIKVVTLPSGAAPKGAINIFAPDGGLDGVLNAEEITAFRTALATMIPFRDYRTGLREKRANDMKMNLAVFGAGKQAEWHIRLALLLAPEEIARVTVVNRGKTRLDRLRATLDAELAPLFPRVTFAYSCGSNNSGKETESESESENKVRNAVAQADAILCCTPSTEPLFPHSYLQHGSAPDSRFISLIGSYKPHMQEVDKETLLSGGGKMLVDSKEACLAESGDLIKADVRGEQLVELGELASGAAVEDDKDRDKDKDKGKGQGNVVFKCVGMGLMDLVVGRQLLGAARARGVGVDISDF